MLLYLLLGLVVTKVRLKSEFVVRKVRLKRAAFNFSNSKDGYLLLGLTNLTNYPATRIYINPRHYSINDLKNK